MKKKIAKDDLREIKTSTEDLDEPGIYEIRIKGQLGDRWAEWFGGLAIIPEEHGNTLLAGTVVDQAALHGLLNKVRDLGLPLRSVNRVGPGQIDSPAKKRRNAFE